MDVPARSAFGVCILLLKASLQIWIEPPSATMAYGTFKGEETATIRSTQVDVSMCVCECGNMRFGEGTEWG